MAIFSHTYTNSKNLQNINLKGCFLIFTEQNTTYMK